MNVLKKSIKKRAAQAVQSQGLLGTTVNSMDLTIHMALKPVKFSTEKPKDSSDKNK